MVDRVLLILFTVLWCLIVSILFWCVLHVYFAIYFMNLCPCFRTTCKIKMSFVVNLCCLLTKNLVVCMWMCVWFLFILLFWRFDACVCVPMYPCISNAYSLLWFVLISLAQPHSPLTPFQCLLSFIFYWAVALLKVVFQFFLERSICLCSGNTFCWIDFHHFWRSFMLAMRLFVWCNGSFTLKIVFNRWLKAQIFRWYFFLIYAACQANFRFNPNKMNDIHAKKRNPKVLNWNLNLNRTNSNTTYIQHISKWRHNTLMVFTWKLWTTRYVSCRL